MLGLDLSEREAVEVFGGAYTLKPVPWAKIEALRIDLASAFDAREAARDRLIEATDEAGKATAFRDLQRASIPYHAACAEIVRWGVDLTPSDALNAVPRVSETFAGRSFDLLAPAVVEALCRVGPAEPGGVRLVDALAARVFEANSVEAADLAGFR